MSVYSEALEEISLSGAIALPVGYSVSTYRTYVRKINEILANSKAEWRVTTHPKQRIIEKAEKG